MTRPTKSTLPDTELLRLQKIRIGRMSIKRECDHVTGESSSMAMIAQAYPRSKCSREFWPIETHANKKRTVTAEAVSAIQKIEGLSITGLA